MVTPKLESIVAILKAISKLKENQLREPTVTNCQSFGKTSIVGKSKNKYFGYCFVINRTNWINI